METSGGDKRSILRETTKIVRGERSENETKTFVYRRGTRELREKAIEDERPAYVHGNQLLSLVMREQMSWMQAMKARYSSRRKVDEIGDGNVPHKLNRKAIGWLRYLYRKCVTNDDWSEDGDPHEWWDRMTFAPYVFLNWISHSHLLRNPRTTACPHFQDLISTSLRTSVFSRSTRRLLGVKPTNRFSKVCQIVMLHFGEQWIG